MKTIKIFRHEQFGEIRICLADAKELFCLSDVCKALAIGNPSDVKRRLSGRGVDTIETPIKNQYGTVVAQKLSYIDEPNLYRCIFQSRKAEAEQFQNWVLRRYFLPSVAMGRISRMMLWLTLPRILTMASSCSTP